MTTRNSNDALTVHRFNQIATFHYGMAMILQREKALLILYSPVCVNGETFVKRKVEKAGQRVNHLIAK